MMCDSSTFTYIIQLIVYVLISCLHYDTHAKSQLIVFDNNFDTIWFKLLSVYYKQEQEDEQCTFNRKELLNWHSATSREYERWDELQRCCYNTRDFCVNQKREQRSDGWWWKNTKASHTKDNDEAMRELENMRNQWLL